MKWNLRAHALGVWCVLMLGLSGPACTVADCPPGTAQVIDNRDRQYPEFDSDWLCLGAWGNAKPTLPLIEPDLSGSWPKDPPGPKDPDAVVRLSILLDSCTVRYHFGHFDIDRKIGENYYTRYPSAILQEMFDRSLCVKDKTNGCDALRECYGLVQELSVVTEPSTKPNPAVAPDGCFDGVSKYGSVWERPNDTLFVNNEWLNCKSLGLECDPNDGGWCKWPVTPCDPEGPQPACNGARPYLCEQTDSGSYSSEQLPACSDFGLHCVDHLPRLHCAGEGAACEIPGDDWLRSTGAIFSFKDGLACESNTVMRGCVSGQEHLIDCSTLGKGFTCHQGAGIATCGLGMECDQFGEAHCEGDSIVVCDAGKIRAVNCKDLGFETCDTDRTACGPTNIGLFAGY